MNLQMGPNFLVMPIECGSGWPHSKGLRDAPFVRCQLRSAIENRARLRRSAWWCAECFDRTRGPPVTLVKGLGVLATFVGNHIGSGATAAGRRRIREPEAADPGCQTLGQENVKLREACLQVERHLYLIFHGA